ncbi:MAG: MarR family winged helix-turn-helix transcriptional regulator [Nocardioidaceae bacterium]
MHLSSPVARDDVGTPVPETVEEALMSTMIAVGRKLRQRQPGDAVDYAAFPILKALSHQGPLRVSGVAQVLGLDASTVSRHARQLEDRGLLERTDDPDDGRASRVAISQHGRGCLGDVIASRRALLAKALADWDETDRETLRLLLSRLLTTLTEQPDEPDRSRTGRPTGTPTGTPTQETTA